VSDRVIIEKLVGSQLAVLMGLDINRGGVSEDSLEDTNSSSADSSRGLYKTRSGVVKDESKDPNFRGGGPYLRPWALRAGGRQGAVPPGFSNMVQI